jgi:hypothetical protein
MTLQLPGVARLGRGSCMQVRDRGGDGRMTFCDEPVQSFFLAVPQLAHASWSARASHARVNGSTGDHGPALLSAAHIASGRSGQESGTASRARMDDLARKARIWTPICGVNYAHLPFWAGAAWDVHLLQYLPTGCSCRRTPWLVRAAVGCIVHHNNTT